MKNIYIILIMIGILASGCGATQVATSRSDVDIYINNVRKGKGRVEMRRRGVPKSATIVAKHKGRTVGRVKVKRRVDVATVFIGIYTYGIGFLFGMSYPSSVLIPLDESKINSTPTTWNSPPGKWGKQ